MSCRKSSNIYFLQLQNIKTGDNIVISKPVVMLSTDYRSCLVPPHSKITKEPVLVQEKSLL